MTTAVDKWPAAARLVAVAAAGHLPTAPTPPQGARPEPVFPAEREVSRRRKGAVSKASSIRRETAGLNPGPPSVRRCHQQIGKPCGGRRRPAGMVRRRRLGPSRSRCRPLLGSGGDRKDRAQFDPRWFRGTRPVLPVSYLRPSFSQARFRRRGCRNHARSSAPPICGRSAGKSPCSPSPQGFHRSRPGPISWHVRRN
jgi:hypothetical protein